MIAALGDFQFKYENFPIDTVSEQIDSGIQKTDRIENTSAIVSNKIQDEELNIAAQLIMHDRKSIDILKNMLKSKKAYPLILSNGNILGHFFVKSISINHSKLMGQISRIKEVNITLWKQ